MEISSGISQKWSDQHSVKHLTIARKNDTNSRHYLYVAAIAAGSFLVWKFVKQTLTTRTIPSIDYKSYVKNFDESNYNYKIKMDDKFDKIPQLEFGDALVLFFEYFDSKWPPFTQFDIGWPKKYLIYSNICDKMPSKLKTLNNVLKFRKWMENELCNTIYIDNCTCYDKILSSIKNDMIKAKSSHNGILFGLLGCLTRLILTYRWGIIPLTPQILAWHRKESILNNNNNTMSFPQCLLEPWVIICKFYGLSPTSNTQSKNIKNNFNNTTNINNYNKCEHVTSKRIVRFSYNISDLNVNKYDKLAFNTETNTFRIFMLVAQNIIPLLYRINESLVYFFQYYKYLSKNNNTDNNCNKYINDYLKLLDNIESCYLSIINHFGNIFHNNIVSFDFIFSNVTQISGWQLGNFEGPSGAEQMIVAIMDIFCLNDKNSKLIEIQMKNHEKHGMISLMVNLLDSLKLTINKRENLLSIKNLHFQIENKLNNISIQVKRFRRMHRNKVFNAIKIGNAKQSASGKILARLKLENSQHKMNRKIDDPFLEDIGQIFYQKMTKYINSTILQQKKQ